MKMLVLVVGLQVPHLLVGSCAFQHNSLSPLGDFCLKILAPQVFLCSPLSLNPTKSNLNLNPSPQTQITSLLRLSSIPSDHQRCFQPSEAWRDRRQQQGFGESQAQEEQLGAELTSQPRGSEPRTPLEVGDAMFFKHPGALTTSLLVVWVFLVGMHVGLVS